MEDRGVYGVARSIWSHAEFADEPFTEREAWLWLCGIAPWKDCVQKGNTGRPVLLRRGEFSVSIRYLSEKWKWESKDRAARFLKRLEKRDMIRDTSRDGSQVYSITHYNDFQTVAKPKRDSNRDDPCDADATAVRQACDKEEETKSINTSSLRSEDRLAPKPTPSEPLPDWLDLEAWKGFVEMRKQRRKPLTGRALKIALGKLERWRAKGHDPTAILDSSTVNAWTDLYEPKENSNVARIKPKRPSTDQHLSGIVELRDDLRAAYRRGG